MPESCAVDLPLARKCQSAILQRLASVGQKVAGEAVGKSETWVSRWKDDHLESCAHLLTALSLKVVPAAHKCYAPDYIEHLHYFARVGMAQQEAPMLEWDAE